MGGIARGCGGGHGRCVQRIEVIVKMQKKVRGRGGVRGSDQGLGLVGGGSKVGGSG